MEEKQSGVWRDGRFHPGERLSIHAPVPPRQEPETMSEAWYELVRKVGEGVGEASVCWDPMDCTGTFMTDKASDVVDKILKAAMAYANRPSLNDSIPDKARKHVYEYIKARLEKTDKHVVFGLENVYTVWSCYILGNWKCLVSTSLPDGMYYEVTFDVDEGEAYIDAYKKFDNIRVTRGEDNLG
jgi:hypothetical protein